MYTNEETNKLLKIKIKQNKLHFSPGFGFRRDFSELNFTMLDLDWLWSLKTENRSCLYYTTDLYKFEVRTECPEVRIKLGDATLSLRMVNEDTSWTCISFLCTFTLRTCISFRKFRTYRISWKLEHILSIASNFDLYFCHLILYQNSITFWRYIENFSI